MSIWKLARTLGAVLLIGAGCGSADHPDTKATSPAAPAPVASATNQIEVRKYPAAAQPKLQTIKLWIGAEEMATELAIAPKEIETGMMHRTAMAENEGMLFIFAYPDQRAFWMKNTLLPLSCAYIDNEGTILETHDMKPKDETLIISNSPRVQFVLEVNQGWFERHNIKPGAIIRTGRGTLAQTFFRRNQP